MQFSNLTETARRYRTAFETWEKILSISIFVSLFLFQFRCASTAAIFRQFVGCFKIFDYTLISYRCKNYFRGNTLSFLHYIYLYDFYECAIVLGRSLPIQWFSFLIKAQFSLKYFKHIYIFVKYRQNSKEREK